MSRRTLFVILASLAVCVGAFVVLRIQAAPPAAGRADMDLASEVEKLRSSCDKLAEQNKQLAGHLVKLRKEHEERLNELKDQVVPPVGSIVAWHRDIDTSKPRTLPRGWVVCDGKTITEGPLKGRATPALNVRKTPYEGGYFLRGGQRSGELQDATALFRKWEGTAGAAVPRDDAQFARNIDGTTHFPSYWNQVTVESRVEKPKVPFIYTRPVNMSVVWIMRVK
jgi:hypothetical protein